MFYDLAFMGYVAENEGLGSTRRAKIEKFIKLLVNSPDPHDECIQNQLFDECGLEYLTPTEKNYIEEEVLRRL